MADRERQRPCTPDTREYIGSITKQFALESCKKALAIDPASDYEKQRIAVMEKP